MSYKKVDSESDLFGNGIRSLGVRPGDKICLFADTRAEWLVSAIGCFKNRIAVCTIYTNLGDEGIIHGITQTQVSTVVTSLELLPKLLAVRDKLEHLKTIIYFDSTIRDSPKENSVEGMDLCSYSRVLELGSEARHEAVTPGPDDTAIIMYTSG